jgi:galactokinase
LAVQRIPLPPAIDLVVIDSGITHRHAGGEYATRRRESFQAAAQLGVPFLRDAGVEALPRLAALDAVLARRARHVITENQRVLDAVAAFRAGNVARIGQLMNESHASMRDDYQTSTPEIDALVAIAQADDAVFGARLTGGGFGGAIVALVKAGHAEDVSARIARQYASRTSFSPTVIVPAGHAS